MPSDKPGLPISEKEIEKRLTPTDAPPSVRIRTANFDPKWRYLHVLLTDGGALHVPLSFYPTLERANKDTLPGFHLIGAGYGLEWEDLDFYLSLEGMLAGRKERCVEVPS